MFTHVISCNLVAYTTKELINHDMTKKWLHECPFTIAHNNELLVNWIITQYNSCSRVHVRNSVWPFMGKCYLLVWWSPYPKRQLCVPFTLATCPLILVQMVLSLVRSLGLWWILQVHATTHKPNLSIFWFAQNVQNS
jgi:hypothetical protein